MIQYADMDQDTDENDYVYGRKRGNPQCKMKIVPAKEKTVNVTETARNAGNTMPPSNRQDRYIVKRGKKKRLRAGGRNRRLSDRKIFGLI